jgi:hypothetical protein
MEEQMERHNPIRGRGATPSMGLSQFRGGRKKKVESESESDEEMEGGGFLSDLGIPVVSNVAGMFGLGHGDEMVGAGDMSRAVGAGRKKKGMSEATQMGLHLGKHLHGLHGAGFWSDFGDGFMSVIRPVASAAKAVLPFTGPAGRLASGALGAVGLGKARRGCGKEKEYLTGT